MLGRFSGPLALTLLFAATGIAQSVPLALSIRATHDSFKSGSDVEIQATLTNLSDEPISCPKMSPVWAFDYDVWDTDGNPVLETQQFDDWKHPKPGGYASAGGSRIKARRDAMVYIPIGEYFNMSRPGTYFIRVRRRPDRLMGEYIESNVIEIKVGQ